MEFVEATDEDWRPAVLGEIVKADCILKWVRPKKSEFPEINLHENPVANYEEFCRLPLSATATGAGLLFELAYLQRLNAMSKSVLFVKESDLRYLKILERFSVLLTGHDTMPKVVSGGVLGAGESAPRLSALDRQLVHLNDFATTATYAEFPPAAIPHFRNRLIPLLQAVWSAQASESRPPKDAMHFGVSEVPRPVFPDYCLKRIRHTPVETIIALPAGELTEVKNAEARSLVPTANTCPRCPAPIERIVFYWETLAPADNDLIRGRCQECGRRTTLEDGQLWPM